jgi:uncharacterized protein YfkK (UPF0435 family)
MNLRRNALLYDVHYVRVLYDVRRRVKKIVRISPSKISAFAADLT